MKQFKKNLGKVSLTPEGIWDGSKEYEILSIVSDKNTEHGFISKREVPAGVDLYNTDYWMPLNVSGYADNNMIIYNDKNEEGEIIDYVLEEAIKSVTSVGRKPGLILCFYNKNNDRLDIGACWEIWQYTGGTSDEWENLELWRNIYYNYNQFVGWYRNETMLRKHSPYPEIGCYAYVGTVLNEASVYRCDVRHEWRDTAQHAWDYVKITIDGSVKIGDNGNWFNDGVDTGIPASIKGENGKTPIFRNKDNKIEFSYDDETWEPISEHIAAWFRWKFTGGVDNKTIGKLQITRDNVNWVDLTNEFTTNLRIERYIGPTEALPENVAEGSIYAKGPFYLDGDIEQTNPVYRIYVYAWKGDVLSWQDTGAFTSITAGIVQEHGDSPHVVMSQEAVTKNFIRSVGVREIDTNHTLEEIEQMKIDGTYKDDVLYIAITDEYE